MLRSFPGAIRELARPLHVTPVALFGAVRKRARTYLVDVLGVSFSPDDRASLGMAGSAFLCVGRTARRHTVK